MQIIILNKGNNHLKIFYKNRVIDDRYIDIHNHVKFLLRYIVLDLLLDTCLLKLK